MVTEKDRRKNGYVTPQSTLPNKLLIKYHLFIEEFYDDWEDYRDSFRDWFRDFKKIKRIHFKRGRHIDCQMVRKRMQMNDKQKRLALRRRRKNWKEGD